MAGDCYEANGNFIITKMNDKSFKLCHGVAILATDNKPFGHCWIEKSNSLVMDFSNGKKLALPKRSIMIWVKYQSKDTRFTLTQEQKQQRKW